MRKKGLKQVVTWILVFVMISVPTFASQTLDTNTRANLKLDEMQYEHIEYSKVEKLIAQLDDIVAREDIEAFYKWDEEYYKLYCEISSMIEIAQLKYMLNMEDEYYFKEYLYSVDLLGKMKADYIECFGDEDSPKAEDMTRYYELSIERSKIVDEYYSKQMGVTIKYGDKDATIVDLFQDNSLTNNQLYNLYDEWYTAYNKATGGILLKLVKIDNEIAKLQGYENYVDYVYESYSRDYSPNEAEEFIANVKEVVPIIYAKLYNSSSVASCILGNYTSEDDESLLNNIDQGFISKHEEFQKAYEYMKKYELYDIDYRDTKTSGGFTKYLVSVKEPFIVLNYASAYQTALSFIHEFGHYFSYYKIGVNSGGLDLDETYSQALELLAMPYYSEIFKDDKCSKAASVYTIESMLQAIIQGCLYDEFLRTVYSNPDMTVDEMNELYSSLAMAYGLKVDGRSWCEVSHNFESPFYYISYSVSAVAALEVWEKSLEDETEGVNTYLKLVEAGKKQTFLESLNAVGLSNPMQKESISNVVASIEQYFDVADSTKQSTKAA